MNTWEILYTLLTKRFKKKPIWSTDAVKLAGMIQLNEQYPSVIVRKTESAVNRINKKTSFKVSLEIHRPRNGKAMITFIKTDS